MQFILLNYQEQKTTEIEFIDFLIFSDQIFLHKHCTVLTQPNRKVITLGLLLGLLRVYYGFTRVDTE